MPGDIHSMKHWKLSKMRTPERSPVIFQAKPCALTGRKKRRARTIEAQHRQRGPPIRLSPESGNDCRQSGASMTRRKYSTVTLVRRNSYLAKPRTPLVTEAITARKYLRLESMNSKRISLDIERYKLSRWIADRKTSAGILQSLV